MLQAGKLNITVEYADNLRDHDIIFRQDPYAKVTCGGTTLRTKTAKSAGTKPVWNEQFSFNIINENDLNITVMDSEVFSDEFLGKADVSLATVRERLQDYQAVQLYTQHGRQCGTINILLTFEPNGMPSPVPGSYPAPQQPMPYPAQPRQPGYPPQYPPQPQYQPQPQYPPQPTYEYPPQPQYPYAQQPTYASPPMQPVYAPLSPPMSACSGYAYPPPQQSGGGVVIVEEGRHHRHHQEEIIVMQPGYGTGPGMVIVEEGHRHHHYW